MSVYCTDHHHPPWIHLRSRQTWVPSILFIEWSSLCNTLWSAGMPASLCAHTAVTFSGIIKESAFLIEIPGKIKRSLGKSVSSVLCHPSSLQKCVCLFFCSSRAVSTWEIYTSCDVNGKKSWCDMSLKLCHNHTRQFTQYRAENNSDSDCTLHVTRCVCFMTSCLGNYGLVLSCSVWLQNLLNVFLIINFYFPPSFFLCLF